MRTYLAMALLAGLLWLPGCGEPVCRVTNFDQVSYQPASYQPPAWDPSWNEWDGSYPTYQATEPLPPATAEATVTAYETTTDNEPLLSTTPSFTGSCDPCRGL